MKNKLLLFCLSLACVFTSCKDEEETPWPKEEPPKPAANFDFTNCEAPCTVNFINISQNATSYNWNFDDGTTSTEVNPKHLYENAGTYNVTLQATGEGGNHTREKQVVISPPVFHLKYKANAVLIESTNITISRNIPTGYMSITSSIAASTPPFFNFVIQEPTTGFTSGSTIILNTSNPQSYASHIDSFNTTFQSIYDATGITLYLNYIKYENGGIISGTFSGSLKTSAGNAVQITEGTLKIMFSN